MAKEYERENLKKGKGVFNLIGKVKLTDNTFKMNTVYDSGWTDNKMYVGVDCGNGNIVYAEMSGGFFPDNKGFITAFSKDDKDEDGKSKKLSISWEDRLDESWVDMVAPSNVFTVGLERDVKGKTVYKKFLHKYDAVKYLNEALKNDMIVNIKGKLTYSQYKENVIIKKEITSIVLSNFENEEDFRATFSQSILLDSSSVGKYNIEKNTISLDGYVVDYVGSPKIDGNKVEIKKNIAFPVSFEIGMDENKEKNEMVSKVLFKTKRGNVSRIQVIGNIIESGSVVNVTEDDITEDVKLMLQLGMYTNDDVGHTCAIDDSPREKRFVIIKPDIERKDNIVSVICDRDIYKEEDLLFYEQALAEAGIDTADNNDDDVENMIDNSQIMGDDLLSMLNMDI